MPLSRNLRLSPEAEDDLRDILQYTSEAWGEERRASNGAALTTAFQNLARFPNLGRAVGGPRASARRFVVEQHVIFDEADDQELRVARILHVRMDAARQGEE